MLNKLSIRWKLLTYMLGFTLIMLILLGIYQSFFMEGIFTMSKRRELNLALLEIKNNLNDQDLQEQLDKLSGEQNICVLITDGETNTLYSSGQSPNCLIHSMSQSELRDEKSKALASGGSYSEIFSDNQNGLFTTSKSRRLVSVSIYDNVIIFLDTSVNPTKITQDFSRAGFVYAALSFLLLTVLLIHILSRGITRPVKQLSNDVRSLSLGDYATRFNVVGCKEVELLSDALNYMVGELNQLEKLRRDMIANISHDIRTPLAAIIGYGELLRDYPQEYSKENLQAILDEANWLSGLVNNLLQISRLQGNVESLVISHFNLTAEIEQILLRFRKLRQKEGFLIHFEYKEQIFIEADRIRISQVVYNIVNNALQHTGKDKTVTVKQTREKEQVLIQIHNSGDYIPAEEIPYIWERYYRGRSLKGQDEGGWGLGLFIVKSILELHNAQYGVDSSPEAGCTFWFRLSRAKDIRQGRVKTADTKK